METTFADLEKNDFFIVKSDCGIITGTAELYKMNGIYAKCIRSENATYIKCKEYIMQSDQVVIKTSN